MLPVSVKQTLLYSVLVVVTNSISNRCPKLFMQSLLLLLQVLDFIRARPCPPPCLAFLFTVGWPRRFAVVARLQAAAAHALVSLTVCMLQASLCHAVQRQRLLSSPRFGALRAYIPRGRLLRRSVVFTDTGMSPHVQQTYVYIYIYIYISIYTYIHIHLSLSLYIYIYIYTYPPHPPR